MSEQCNLEAIVEQAGDIAEQANKVNAVVYGLPCLLFGIAAAAYIAGGGDPVVGAILGGGASGGCLGWGIYPYLHTYLLRQRGIDI